MSFFKIHKDQISQIVGAIEALLPPQIKVALSCVSAIQQLEPIIENIVDSNKKEEGKV